MAWWQWGTLGGDDRGPVPRVAPEEAGFAPRLLPALPGRRRPGADALLLEPRGGLNVLVALAGGAREVTAVEPYGPLVDVLAAAAPAPTTIPG